jgi:hypothetical protein
MVENKIEILFALVFEHPVGTDQREAFRNRLGNDEAVGRVVMTGHNVQMCKGAEVFFLHVINHVAQLFPDVRDDVLRLFPPFGSDSAVLIQMDSFLYTLGTDVNPVFVVLKKVKDVIVQRTKIVGGVKHKDVRIYQVSHTAYFITARMSTISIAPPGFARLHRAAFDSLGGGTYGVSSFPALAFLGVAGLDIASLGVVALDAFAVMTVQFYDLWMQRYNFSGSSQKTSPPTPPHKRGGRIGGKAVEP